MLEPLCKSLTKMPSSREIRTILESTIVLFGDWRFFNRNVSTTATFSPINNFCFRKGLYFWSRLTSAAWLHWRDHCVISIGISLWNPILMIVRWWFSRRIFQRLSCIQIFLGQCFMDITIRYVAVIPNHIGTWQKIVVPMIKCT